MSGLSIRALTALAGAALLFPSCCSIVGCGKVYLAGGEAANPGENSGTVSVRVFLLSDQGRYEFSNAKFNDLWKSPMLPPALDPELTEAPDRTNLCLWYAQYHVVDDHHVAIDLHDVPKEKIGTTWCCVEDDYWLGVLANFNRDGAKAVFRLRDVEKERVIYLHNEAIELRSGLPKGSIKS